MERQDIKGTTGSREGQGGQDTSEPAQEGEHLPNSYCEIIVNDDMVYKTRVKQYSSMPYFEAGTERFVRDWKDTVVRVQVRDARYVFCAFVLFGVVGVEHMKRGVGCERRILCLVSSLSSCRSCSRTAQR